jgi:hypothetical protein
MIGLSSVVNISCSHSVSFRVPFVPSRFQFPSFFPFWDLTAYLTAYRLLITRLSANIKLGGLIRHNVRTL